MAKLCKSFIKKNPTVSMPVVYPAAIQKKNMGPQKTLPFPLIKEYEHA